MCAYIHVYICTHIHIFICMHVYIHIYMYVILVDIDIPLHDTYAYTIA